MSNREKGRGDVGGRGGRGKLSGVIQGISDAFRGGVERLSAAADDEESLDALDLLTAQHHYIERLFGQLESASGEAKSRLFGDLADMLAVHAAIEEKIFYPTVKMAATEPLLHASVQEHLEVKRLLVELMESGVDDESFDEKAVMLKEMVEHHARHEEEGKLFPILRKQMDGELLEALGAEMIALMVELQRQRQPPRAAIPSETDAPAPI